VVEGFTGPNQHSIEGHGVIVLKDEAVSAARLGIEVGDRISKTSGCSHDGYASIAQGEQLPQPTGFKARGHEEHVGTGVDALRQGGVESEEHAHLLGVLRRQVTEHFVVFLVAGSE